MHCLALLMRAASLTKGMHNSPWCGNQAGDGVHFCLCAGHRQELLAFHTHVLEWASSGKWALSTAQDYGRRQVSAAVGLERRQSSSAGMERRQSLERRQGSGAQ